MSDDSDVRLFNLKDVQIIGCQTAWSLTITGFLRIRRRSGKGLAYGKFFTHGRHTGWCPPSYVCRFINPMNTRVISAIDHRIQPLF